MPTEATTSLVRCDKLGLLFPSGFRALEDVSLDVAAGEFVAIVGPSGCGKSTLLRLVAGLLDPTEGAVQVRGVNAGSARKANGNTSFVFQSATLLPWRTVEANVRLPLELRARTGVDKVADVRGMLDLVGLHDFAGAYPHQLSGGMQMRVSLARALVTRPDLLLMDEPFGALDDITRQRLNDELMVLWERDQFTALFVTHNVSEAVFLANRVVVMSPRPGRIVADHPIPFPHPRDPSLRTTPEFASLCGHVSASLGGDHR